MASSGNDPPAPGRMQRVESILLGVLFVSLFFALTIPAFDSDFWWHLASGRWMWKHQTLMQADPFDFTSVIFSPASQVGYQLTQYWGAQLLLYSTYLTAGLKGVALLRAAVFTGLLYFLFRLLRRTGGGVLLCVLLLAIAFRAIVQELVYINDRPQMWSSLFFVALLLILENLREGRRWARFALAPFMLLWANLHGGYILGVVVIVFAVAAAHLSRHGERRQMLLVAAVAIILAGCNPAGHEALFEYPLSLLPGSNAEPGIYELESLFRYVSVSALPRAMPGLTAIYLLPFLTLLPRLKSLSRGRWDIFLVYLLTLGLGIKAQRFLIFMIPMACWMTALNIAALRERKPQLRLSLHPVPQWALGALTAAALISLAATYSLVALRSSLLRPSAAFRVQAQDAVEFLSRSGFKGNIFNDYFLGGYLTWRLPPEMKIFIYGRAPYPKLLTLYNDVVNYPSKTISLTAAGRVQYFYQKVFEEYSIDAVIVPAGDGRSGAGILLAARLAWDDDWALVYAEPEALVFLRKTPALAHLVTHPLPKSAVFDSLIAVARRVSQTSHGRYSPVWRRSLVLAYYGKGQKAEALRIFDDYGKQAPLSAEDLQLRDSIANEIGGGKSP